MHNGKEENRQGKMLHNYYINQKVFTQTIVLWILMTVVKLIA